MELKDIRREYAQGGLRRKDLAADPIDQFNLWLEQAIEAKLTDPTARHRTWQTWPRHLESQ